MKHSLHDLLAAMNPVLVFRHSPTEGPGYCATYLERHGLSWALIRVDEGEPIPADPRPWSGLVFMGGPMSVNDDLAWIPDALGLIRAAVTAQVPVLGHCLGGQLIAKALGGAVTRNPLREIGWGKVRVDGGKAAREWFGEIREFLAFHWHGEAFSVPAGATRLASSRHCANQAFAVAERHLALQCHVEMTAELISAWCEDWEKELRRKAGASIQTPEQMHEGLDARVRALHVVADRLYDRWIQALR
jgi:GMP synthase-like glutamine amidotransferase